MKFPLGFRQLPDERDEKFPLSALMSASRKRPVSKVWKAGPVLNQGTTSSCVGHACYQLQVSEPVLSPSPLDPFFIYDQAQLIDEWKGENKASGTSVRAGLNVLKREGKISNYFWGTNADEALEYLLKFGPLVFGTPWYNDMFEADNKGFVHPGGSSAGGHAYLAHSGHLRDKTITYRNSWGESFGKSGDFKMHLKDVDDLLREGGCFAACTEPS